jgi:hypothetical protein
MYRLIVFDLDSTLAPIGRAMKDEDVALLRRLEEKGARIALCSGKTCDYLCGFLRQLGLQNPVMIGENGADIRFGIDLPPREHYRLPISRSAEQSLKRARQLLDELYPHLWYQPNLVEVTPFPTSEEEFENIAACLAEHKEELQDVDIFRYVDSFDIVPAGLNKAKGIDYLLELLHLTWQETIAVGDGVNDYCMFARAGYSVGVRVKEPERVTKNCDSTTQALEVLIEMLSD